MKKRTEQCQFSKATKKELLERDRGCYYCKRGVHMDKVPHGSRIVLDPCHVVNKSQGGLGVIENGVIACRGHHHLLDNSEHNEEMRRMARIYLEVLYPGWTEASVTYNKWQGFKYQ